VKDAVPAAGVGAGAGATAQPARTVVAPVRREPGDQDPVVVKSTDPLSG
jgi:hypothetical protein